MITTDTGAKKWENSDNWRQIYQAHNDSVDAEDAAIAALQDGLAIVANGNTHAAIAAGQFVFVKNHDTLATGLYTASAAIAANATLSGSNLTADASGGLNALNSKLTTQVITFANIADSIKENVTGDLSKNGDRCDLYLAFSNASMSDGQNHVGTLKPAYRPSMTYSIGLIYSKSSPYMPVGTVWVYSTGYVYAYCNNGSLAGYAYVSYNI